MIRDDTPLASSSETFTDPLDGLEIGDGSTDIDLLDRLPAPRALTSLDNSLPEALPGALPGARLLAILETAQALRIAQEEERRLAPGAATQLERHPETRARLLIDNQRRFRTWGLAEELLDRCHQALFDADSCRAVRIARLAVTVADRVETSIYGDSLTADLRARCWGNLCNAYRCSGRLEAAVSALERAEELLVDGTGDPLEEATLLQYRASLATSFGELERSAAVLEDVCSIYQELGETRLLARTLLKLSTPHGFLDPELGAATARRAEKLLDPDEDARLFLGARHNQIRFIIDAGNPEHAAMLLKGSRKLYRREPSRWIQLNLGWSEARLAAALGDLREAEAAYEVLLRELLDHGYHLDGAHAALDLAATRIGLGKFRDAGELAAGMAQHFREWGAHARARTAWALLQHALEAERATTELIREVAVYLRRSWNNPEVPLSHELQRELRRQRAD